MRIKKAGKTSIFNFVAKRDVDTPVTRSSSLTGMTATTPNFLLQVIRLLNNRLKLCYSEPSLNLISRL